MGDEKLAAALHNPLGEAAEPVGEYPDLPARSGVTALLNAADTISMTANELESHRAAVDEIKAYCDGRHVVGAVEIRNILQKHSL